MINEKHHASPFGFIKTKFALILSALMKHKQLESEMTAQLTRRNDPPEKTLKLGESLQINISTPSGSRQVHLTNIPIPIAIIHASALHFTLFVFSPRRARDELASIVASAIFHKSYTFRWVFTSTADCCRSLRCPVLLGTVQQLANGCAKNRNVVLCSTLGENETPHRKTCLSPAGESRKKKQLFLVCSGTRFA